MEESDKPKTAFLTRNQWVVLVHSDAFWTLLQSSNRLMDTVLTGVNYKTCIVYIEEINVFGRTFEDTPTQFRAGIQETLRCQS
jgi:hypothetical protein